MLRLAIMLLLVACGAKEAPPKSEFEAFERKFIRQEAALVEGARRMGKNIGPAWKSYRAVYIGPSGIYVDRKLVAALSELDTKRAEITAALDENAKLMKSLGTQLHATWALDDKQPASTAVALLRLFADREMFHEQVVVDPEIPVKVSQHFGLGNLYASPFAEKDQPQLSILLEQGRIWVGLSQLNEFYEIPDHRDYGRDFEKLETVLKEHKAGGFAERSGLELAATAGSAWDVLTATDIATKVGFIHVAVLPRDQLSAVPTL